MTRPKFRSCPSCQTPNQASRKTCHVCFGSLSTKKKINEKVASLDSQWGKSVLKSRNAGRLIDSARIAVQKLEAVGYKPILFIGKQDKRASNKWVADIITHLHHTPVTKILLEKMRRAYEFILTKATSTAQQPESVAAEQPESVAVEQLESQTMEQPESLTAEQPESIAVEQPESIAVEQPESQTMEQPERIAVEQPESQTMEQPESIAMEQPESVSVEQPESLTAEQLERQTTEQPESLTKQSEPVFVLNLVPVSSSLSPTFLSPPSSATPTTVLPSLSSPPPPPLRQRKRRLNTFTASHSTTPVSTPYPSPSSISKPLSQEVPLVKNRRKGCRKCSRQKVFLFDKITGERINEGKAELKVHWLPCTVCGKTWDDTWEPASEFQNIVPKSPHPNQLSA
ncbi:flocculation protein FLO11-like [Megalobrama amblycephala]|uniref:flocculation protein FLO11-like n=1 Tax=Megalobrama amblycephala TaxID=75352 RepID=UPI0020142FD6|nr:flocculation protein FLO11-like [Megalobrama amblycephala]